uniref:Uncharacterized protein n=1 Tax=Panagrolaimus sp. ES5 TaxID=591445 RepID=A0AC34GB30_9BILA
MEIGRHCIILSSIFIFLLTTFPCFIEAKRPEVCPNFTESSPIYEFKGRIDHWLARSGDFVHHPSKYGMEKCKEGTCAVYLCVEDGSVIYGGGCITDYQKTCYYTTTTASPPQNNNNGGLSSNNNKEPNAPTNSNGLLSDNNKEPTAPSYSTGLPPKKNNNELSTTAKPRNNGLMNQIN